MYTSAADKISVSNSRRPQTKKGHSAHNKKAISSGGSNSFSFMGLVRFAAGVWLTSVNSVSAHTHGAPLAHQASKEVLFANYTIRDGHKLYTEEAYDILTEQARTENGHFRKLLNIADSNSIDTSACYTPVKDKDDETNTQSCLDSATEALATEEAKSQGISARTITQSLTTRLVEKYSNPKKQESSSKSSSKSILDAFIESSNQIATTSDFTVQKGEVFALSDGKVYSKTCGFSAQEISDAMNVLVNQGALGFRDKYSSLVTLYKQDNGNITECTTQRSLYTAENLKNCVTQINAALQNTRVKSNGITDTNVAAAIQSYATANGVVTIVTDGDQCAVTFSPTTRPTANPTLRPTSSPTLSPIIVITTSPTASPSTSPTQVQTAIYTFNPTGVPTPAPQSGARINDLERVFTWLEETGKDEKDPYKAVLAVLIALTALITAGVRFMDRHSHRELKRLVGEAKRLDRQGNEPKFSLLMAVPNNLQSSKELRLLINTLFLSQYAKAYVHEKPGPLSCTSKDKPNPNLHVKPTIIKLINQIYDEVQDASTNGSTENIRSHANATETLIKLFVSSIDITKREEESNNAKEELDTFLNDLELGRTADDEQLTSIQDFDINTAQHPDAYTTNQAKTLARILSYISRPLYHTYNPSSQVGEENLDIEMGYGDNQRISDINVDITGVEDDLNEDKVKMTPIRATSSHEPLSALSNRSSLPQTTPAFTIFTEQEDVEARAPKYITQPQPLIKTGIQTIPSTQGKAAIQVALIQLLRNIKLFTNEIITKENSLEKMKQKKWDQNTHSQHRKFIEKSAEKSELEKKRKLVFKELSHLFPKHAQKILSQSSQENTYVVTVGPMGTPIVKMTNQPHADFLESSNLLPFDSVSIVQAGGSDNATILSLTQQALDHPDILFKVGFTPSDAMNMDKDQLKSLESLVHTYLEHVADDIRSKNSNPEKDAFISLMTSKPYRTRVDNNLSLNGFFQGLTDAQMQKVTTKTPFPRIVHVTGLNVSSYLENLDEKHESIPVQEGSWNYWWTANKFAPYNGIKSALKGGYIDSTYPTPPTTESRWQQWAGDWSCGWYGGISPDNQVETEQSIIGSVRSSDFGSETVSNPGSVGSLNSLSTNLSNHRSDTSYNDIDLFSVGEGESAYDEKSDGSQESIRNPKTTKAGILVRERTNYTQLPNEGAFTAPLPVFSRKSSQKLKRAPETEAAFKPLQNGVQYTNGEAFPPPPPTVSRQLPLKASSSNIELTIPNRTLTQSAKRQPPKMELKLKSETPNDFNSIPLYSSDEESNA